MTRVKEERILKKKKGKEQSTLVEISRKLVK